MSQFQWHLKKIFRIYVDFSYLPFPSADRKDVPSSACRKTPGEFWRGCEALSIINHFRRHVRRKWLFSGASAGKKAFPHRFLLNSQWSPAAIKVSRSLAHWPRSPLDAPLARGSFGPGNSCEFQKTGPCGCRKRKYSDSLWTFLHFTAAKLLEFCKNLYKHMNR